MHYCQEGRMVQAKFEWEFLRIQGWEFIKEKKKVNKKVNTHASTQKRTRSRKHALVHANTRTRKCHAKRTRARKRARKHANTSACLRGRVRVFLPEFFFCVDAFVYECVFSWTSSFFAWTRACLRGRVRVYFLFNFFFSLINSQPRTPCIPIVYRVNSTITP